MPIHSLRAHPDETRRPGGDGPVRVLFRWGISTIEDGTWECEDRLGRALLDSARGETPGYPEVSDRDIARYAARLLDGEILAGPEGWGG